MTIRAFLKSEEKKRSKEVGPPVVQSVEQATPAPVPSHTPAPVAAAPNTEIIEDATHGAANTAEAPGAWERANTVPGEAVPSVEVCSSILGTLVHATDL